MFKTINTSRLFLRKLKISDWEVVLYLRSDADITKYIKRPENRQTKNKSDAINHIQKINTETENNVSFSWGITLKNNPKIIGTICLWNLSEDRKTAEVGYDLGTDFQGQGIMQESLTSVLEYGFKTLQLENIEAYTHRNNKSSINLLERNGFHLLKDKVDENNLDNVIYTIERL